MTALPMTELLKRGESFHLELARYYRSLSEKAEREETRELLDYLSRHEGNLGHCIEDCGREAPPAAAGHCFQWVPDVDAARHLAPAALPADAGSAEVIALARRLEDCQVQLYQELVETCPPGDLRDLLGGLLEVERQQEKLLVWNLQTW